MPTLRPPPTSRSCGILSLTLLLAALFPHALLAARLAFHRIAPGGFDTAPRAVASSDTVWIAVGDRGAIHRSSDGIAWTPVPSPASQRLLAVCWDGSAFHCAGENGILLTSPDGTQWTARASTNRGALSALLPHAGSLVVGGDSGAIALWNPGSGVWQASSGAPVLGRINSMVLFDGGMFAVTESGELLSAPDGTTWESELRHPDGGFSSLAAGGSAIAAVGANGRIARRTHSGSWLLMKSGSARLRAITGSGSPFVAVGDSGTVVTVDSQGTVAAQFLPGAPDLTCVWMTSTGFAASDAEGGIWTSDPAGQVWSGPSRLREADLLAVMFSADHGFLAAGAAGRLLHSIDGRQWAERVSGTSNDLQGIAGGLGVCVAVGTSGTILRSTGGSTWQRVASGTESDLHAVTFDGRGFIAAGTRGRILESADGLTWSVRQVGTDADAFHSVAISRGAAMAVGDFGRIAVRTEPSTWSVLPPHPSDRHRWLDVLAVGASGERWVAAARGSLLLASSNGQDWTKPVDAVTPGVDRGLLGALGDRFIAAGAGSACLTSLDGLVWSEQNLPAFARLHAAAASATDVVLVGDAGTLLHATRPVFQVVEGPTVVPIGSPVSLSANVSGLGPLALRWYEGERGDVSRPLDTSPGGVCTIPSLDRTRRYWALATDAQGSETASNAITVVARGIARQPSDVLCEPSANVSLSIDAGGAGTLSYQWYRGAAGDARNPVAGATSHALSLNPVESGAAYWVRVTDELGSFESAPAVVRLRRPTWTAWHAGWPAQGDGLYTTSGAARDAVVQLRDGTTGAPAGGASIRYSWTGTYNVRTDHKPGWATGTDAYTRFQGKVGLGSQADNVSAAGSITISLLSLDPSRSYELAVFAGRDSSLFAATNLNAYTLEGADVLSTGHSTGVSGSGPNASVPVGLGCRAAGRVVAWTFRSTGGPVSLRVRAAGGAANAVVPQAVMLREYAEDPVVRIHSPDTVVGASDSPSIQIVTEGTVSTVRWFREDASGYRAELVGETSPMLTLPPNGRSARYSARIVGPSGTVESAPITVLVRRTFSEWALLHHRQPNADEDPDGNGIPELLDYALGIEGPASAAESPRPVLSLEGGQLALTYPVSLETLGVRVEPQMAQGLAATDWISAGLETQRMPSNSFTRESVRSTAPMPSGSRLFIRLTATPD